MSDALYLVELVAYDPGAGLAPIADYTSVGDAAWTSVNTPTRSIGAANISGLPIDLIGDDNAAATEGFYRAITFTGTADKVISFWMKRSSAYAGHSIQLYDNSVATFRLNLTVDFTGTTPVVTASTGTVLGVIPEGGGFWVVCLASGVIAANANLFIVYPAWTAVADLASLYIGAVRAWNSATYVGPILLRYASQQGHTTTPAETPANAHYEPRIKQPVNVKRDLFDSGTTAGRSRMGFGDLVLWNPDGVLDVLLTYGLSGRSLTIRRGGVGAAYPAGFPSVWGATMEQVEAVGDTIVVKLRDWQLLLDAPLQTTKYLGNNSLPAGLEGVAGDLLGKPKPLCFGSAQNVPAPCVNTPKQIYQAHDGAVASIDAVYDRGVLLATRYPLVTRTHAFGNNQVLALCTGPGLMVAAGVNGHLETSPDGITWTAQTSGFGASTIRGLCYGEGLYVAVGDGGKIYTSPDGVTWTSRASGLGAVAITAVAYGGGQFMCVVNGGPNATYSTSNDGITWTNHAQIAATNANVVIYGFGLWVVGMQSGAIYTSPDQTTWTSRTMPFSNQVRGLGFGNGLLMSGHESSKLATSRDGITWVEQTVGLGTSSILSCIPLPDNTWLVTGSDSGTGLYAATSPNGVNWTTITLGPPNNVYAAIWSQAVGRIVTGGGTGATAAHIYSSIAYGAEGTYANTTELLDDALAPTPGYYKSYLAGGYFRLGSSPAGLVTADVTQGAAAANRTAAQLWTVALTKAGYAGTWNAGDVTALDAANSAVCGDWIREETSIAAVLDRCAAAVGAWWGVDLSGVYRIKQFTAPTGTSLITWERNDLLRPLQRVAARDASRGLPTWRTIVRYGRNFAVQQQDLAAGVSDARRAFLALEWREAKAEDAAVQTVHTLAAQTVEETLLSSASDAGTEATRRQTLRGVLRNRYLVVVAFTDETKALDLGDIVTLQVPRYGLTAGVKFRIIGVEPDAAAETITFTVWG